MKFQMHCWMSWVLPYLGNRLSTLWSAPILFIIYIYTVYISMYCCHIFWMECASQGREVQPWKVQSWWHNSLYPFSSCTSFWDNHAAEANARGGKRLLVCQQSVEWSHRALERQHHDTQGGVFESYDGFCFERFRKRSWCTQWHGSTTGLCWITCHPEGDVGWDADNCDCQNTNGIEDLWCYYNKVFF